MRARRNASLAFVLFLLMFWAVLPVLVQAQGSDGQLTVSTDYELFGTSDLRGGGHVTWTLTGEKATDLRMKILHLFDTYPTIPRGFPSEGMSTNRNPNQLLDAEEGVTYTNLLEARLEAAGKGTIAQYMRLYPFDLRDKSSDEPSSFARSTSGLAGTDANTTGNVEIRFLFQANTTTGGRLALATRVLVDSLYEPFSYRAAQSATLAGSDPYPAWPFLQEGRWHVVNATGRPAFWGGRPAFWAGNDSTGVYDANVNVATRTSMDPVFVPILSSYEPFDFRYATRARATFNYTGTVGLGDSLRLEYAHPPAYTDWTNLPFSTGASLPPSSTAWSNVSVDLTPMLGQVARLRFHFVSDTTGQPSDIFVRDFALEAPASYVGEVVESDVHYLVGTLSFSNPNVSTGGIHLIRTPGGELLTYGTRWDGSPPASDRIEFRTFDIPENPQILFGVMLIATYGISRMQASAYETYREAHLAVYRPGLRRTKWLHRSGKVAIGVLILLYFIPTAFWVIGLRVVVSGILYLVLAPSVALLLGVGTSAHYRRRLEPTPGLAVEEEGPLVHKVVLSPPPGTTSAARAIGQCTRCLREIGEGDPTYQCTCGASYHRSCATSLARCSNCRTSIAPTVLRSRKQISVRCESCGEPQTILEGTDPRAATCPNCGGSLRHLDEGKRYLIVASNPAIALAWMRDLVKGGRPALCLTPASPERLRLEFGVTTVSIVQVSSTAAGAIDPKKLDPLGLRAILPLSRKGQGGVILYDGLDEAIAEASLGDVLRFLRKANDMAFVHGVTVIARVAPGRLTEDEVKRLNAEFDEYLDLSSQL
jgi:uncharacterized protein DUF835